MENTTQFDLNNAIAEWRRDLAGSPAFRSSDLDELEAHLRDSIADLQKKGLSPEESFFIGKRRLGSRDSLDNEFGKTNVEQVWVTRALWMVAGFVAIGLIPTFVSILANLTGVLIHTFTRQAALSGPVSAAVYLIAFILLLSSIWRSGKSSNGVVWKAYDYVFKHPVVSVIGIFLFGVLSGIGSYGTSYFIHKGMPPAIVANLLTWTNSVSALTSVVWTVALGWLVIRARRKPALG